MGVWLFGSNANHIIGASGLIFLYLDIERRNLHKKHNHPKLRDVVLGSCDDHFMDI